MCLQESATTCRERCGGGGYLAANRFGSLIGFAHAGMTAEGDNSVLFQKVARELLTTPQQAAAAQVKSGCICTAAQKRERALVADASRMLQVHLAGVDVLHSQDDLLALLSARHSRLLDKLKHKMAAAAMSGGSQAKEVRQTYYFMKRSIALTHSAW